MNISLAPLELPIRWNGKDYTISKLGIQNDVVYAETIPNEPKLVSELILNVQQNNGLAVHLCPADCPTYMCFSYDDLIVR